MEHTLSSSPATSSSLKGKKEALTKQSEAMDFREWCESECLRLLGTKDTSFLQFCLNQTRSEAEVLLTENLGSFDPDHEFIHKFLDYKELLPADVLEIALQSGGSNQKATGRSAADSTSDGAAFDVATKGGGRKKGKKGKKVSLSELGFNVVSNRIMMGEIQTLED
nr:PERQ amino acid-rich with GYF domain-containing protein 2, putative isoform 1 [Ipomoea batatas]